MRLAVGWINCTTGESRMAAAIEGGEERRFNSPLTADAVLHVKQIN